MHNHVFMVMRGWVAHWHPFKWLILHQCQSLFAFFNISLFQMFGNWTFGTLVFTILVFTVTLKVIHLTHVLWCWLLPIGVNLTISMFPFLTVSACFSLPWTHITGRGSTTLSYGGHCFSMSSSPSCGEASFGMACPNILYTYYHQIKYMLITYFCSL